MKVVKLYGARNTGTIFLEWILKKNLEITLHTGPDLGWKHRIAPSEPELTEEQKQNIIFICIVKNPYSWILSMHKRPYHHESLKDLSFSEFIKYSYGDYQNPMVMWNKKNSSYLELGNYVKNHHIVKYEDLLVDIKDTVNEVSSKFNIEKPELYKNIKNLLTNSHGIKNQKFHKEYYIGEKWRKKLRSRHVDAINEYLDEDLMKKFNYNYL